MFVWKEKDKEAVLKTLVDLMMYNVKRKLEKKITAELKSGLADVSFELGVDPEFLKPLYRQALLEVLDLGYEITF